MSSVNISPGTSAEQAASGLDAFARAIQPGMLYGDVSISGETLTYRAACLPKSRTPNVIILPPDFDPGQAGPPTLQQQQPVVSGLNRKERRKQAHREHRLAQKRKK